MSTENQIDMIRRICRTHQIDVDSVAQTTGPLEGLADDQAKAVICALADGDFGGITVLRRRDGRCTARQISTLYRVAYEALDPPLMDQTWAYIRQYYPDVANVTSLSRRQATRIIAELDRLAEQKGKKAPGWVTESVA